MLLKEDRVSSEIDRVKLNQIVITLSRLERSSIVKPSLYAYLEPSSKRQAFFRVFQSGQFYRQEL